VTLGRLTVTPGAKKQSMAKHAGTPNVPVAGRVSRVDAARTCSRG